MRKIIKVILPATAVIATGVAYTFYSDNRHFNVPSENDSIISTRKKDNKEVDDTEISNTNIDHALLRNTSTKIQQEDATPHSNIPNEIRNKIGDSTLKIDNKKAFLDRHNQLKVIAQTAQLSAPLKSTQTEHRIHLKNTELMEKHKKLIEWGQNPVGEPPVQIAKEIDYSKYSNPEQKYSTVSVVDFLNKTPDDLNSDLTEEPPYKIEHQ